MHPAIFSIGDAPPRAAPTVPTGFAALDSALAGAGWPCGALTELLCDGVGQGELSLLLPAHGSLTKAAKARAFWVAPPYLPYAPALDAAGVDLQKLVMIDAPDSCDALWAAEQVLAAAAFVVLWQKSFIPDVALRRLQYAAAKSASVCWLVRPSQFAEHASPASLRVQLKAEVDGALTLRLLKQRGLPPHKTLTLDTRALRFLAARRPTPIAVADSAALPLWHACTVEADAVRAGIRPRALTPDR